MQLTSAKPWSEILGQPDFRRKANATSLDKRQQPLRAQELRISPDIGLNLRQAQSEYMRTSLQTLVDLWVRAEFEAREVVSPNLRRRAATHWLWAVSSTTLGKRLGPDRIRSGNRQHSSDIARRELHTLNHEVHLFIGILRAGYAVKLVAVPNQYGQGRYEREGRW